MPRAPQWDGKVHKAVKFGDSFDFRTVEGRKRAAQTAAEYRRDQAAIEAAKEEPQWWLWRFVSTYLDVFRLLIPSSPDRKKPKRGNIMRSLSVVTIAALVCAAGAVLHHNQCREPLN
jgi:hypothetical protein